VREHLDDSDIPIQERRWWHRCLCAGRNDTPSAVKKSARVINFRYGHIFEIPSEASSEEAYTGSTEDDMREIRLERNVR